VIRRILSVIVALLVLHGFTSAQDYSWTNAAGGNWNVATNWSGNVIPGATNNVFLNSLANAYTVNLTDSRSINNLTINAANATLNLTGNLTVGGAFNLTAGSYGLSGGTLVVNGSMTSASGTTFTWTGGSIGGTGTVTLGGSATLSGSGIGSGVTVNAGATVVVSGTTTLGHEMTLRLDESGSGGRVRVANGGVLVGSAGSNYIWGLDNAASSYGQFEVLAGGTLRKTGAGVLSLGRDVVFDFAGGSTLEAVDASSTMLLGDPAAGRNPIFRLNGTVTTSGAGVVRFGFGQMVPDGNATIAGDAFRWTGGAIGGTEGSSLTLSGNATLSGSGIGSGVTVNAGATAVVSGTTTLGHEMTLRLDELGSGGRVRVANGGVLVGSAGSNYIWGLDNAASSYGRFDVLQGGTLRKTGSGVLSLGRDVVFDFAGGGTLEAVDASSTILLGDPAGLRNPIFQINGTVTTSGAGVVRFGFGQMVPIGHATIAGNAFQWLGGSIGGAAGSSLTLSGNAAFTGSGLTVQGNATVVVGGTTTLGHETRLLLDEIGGRVRVANGGVLVGGAGSNYIWGLDNAASSYGQFEVLAGGTLRKSGSGVLYLGRDVIFDFAGGSTLEAVNADSTILLGDPAAGRNPVFQVSGTVTTSGAGAVRLGFGQMVPIGNATIAGNTFQWLGGSIGGAAGSSLTLSGNAAFTGSGLTVQGNATVVVGGTTTLGHETRLLLDEIGGRVRVANGGVLVGGAGSNYIWGLDNAASSYGQFEVLAGGTLRKIESGTLSLARDVIFDISGTVDVQGGAIFISSSSNLLSHSANTLTKGTWLVSNGTLDFNGRTVQTLGANATVELSGSTATFTAMNSLTQNNGTLRILGGHTFTPTAATVNNAGLIEIGSGSTFAKSIAVQNNGILRGSGAVTGNVAAQSGGTVAPGMTNSTGNLTLNGNLGLQSGSTLNLKLNGTSAGTNHDRLTVNGTVDLGNSTLLGTVNYSALTSDKLFILLNDGSDPITGTFNGLSNGSQVQLGSYFANISYFGDSTSLALSGGNDVVLYDFTPVPEPGSILAVAAFGIALGAIRRVTRRKQHLFNFDRYALAIIAGLWLSTSGYAQTTYVWGSDFGGALGNGSSPGSSTPTALGGITGSGQVQFTGGDSFTVAIKNGGVYSNGYNLFGQVGDGTTTNRQSPVQLTGVLSSGVTAVSAGQSNSLAIKDGGVYAWGQNNFGQVGDGTQTRRTSPVALSGVMSSGVSVVAAGNQHSLAIKDGGVYAWGLNTSGALGDGTTTLRTSPVAISGAMSSGVDAISGGNQFSLALKGGAVYSWGSNGVGTLGNGTTTGSLTPTLATGELAAGVSRIEAGYNHALAIKNGTVYAWGHNQFGELGDGTTTVRSTAIAVPGLSGTFVDVAAGYGTSYAMAADGRLYSWGQNADGQLGDGTTTNRLTPTEILPPSGFLWSTIDVGDYHVIATVVPVPEPISVFAVALLAVGAFAGVRRVAS
jgi:alpha-tubulin suppressor-like RCC1 family protein